MPRQFCLTKPSHPAKLRNRWILTSVAVLALIPTWIKLLCYPNNIGSDDAYIHLQVARNVVSGHGWGLNAGTPVNLSSSPAFTLLLIAISHLTVHVIPVMQVLSCIASGLGLLLIFLTVYSETGSAYPALLAEGSASFSCNLFRWNGTVMEACCAFFVVALLLFLFRSERVSTRKIFFFGVVSGVATLLRPELFLVTLLCTCVVAVRSDPKRRIQGAVSVLAMLAGASFCLIPWLIFARITFHNYLPTTFYAKSYPHLIAWNPIIAKQMLELTGESFLWPALLLAAFGWLLLRWRVTIAWKRLLLPIGLPLGVTAFYYLKTPGLESAGRYMLPLLPCAAVALGVICFEVASVKESRLVVALSIAMMSLHVVTSLAINQIYLAPTVARFEEEYGATMRAAAEFIATQTSFSNEGVLVEADVGVLAYAANGRFLIYDGGGLASPELVHLSPAEQVQLVQPAYIVESQGSEAAEWEGKDGGRLRALWSRMYKQHSVSQKVPYLFANVYASSLNAPDTCCAR